MAQTADRDANRALRTRFDEVYGQYERLRSGLDDLQRQLAELRVTAQSRDGLVSATVGPRGQLIKLDLDRRIYRNDNVDELAATITDTVHRATEEVTVRVRELVGGYLPAGTGAADFIRDGNFGSLLRRSDAAMHEEDGRGQ